MLTSAQRREYSAAETRRVLNALASPSATRRNTSAKMAHACRSICSSTSWRLPRASQSTTIPSLPTSPHASRPRRRCASEAVSLPALRQQPDRHLIHQPRRLDPRANPTATVMFGLVEANSANSAVTASIASLTRPGRGAGRMPKRTGQFHAQEYHRDSQRRRNFGSRWTRSSLSPAIRCGPLCFTATVPRGSRPRTTLRASEARLRSALDAARMVAWEYDPATLAVTLSDNAEKVLDCCVGTRTAIKATASSTPTTWHATGVGDLTRPTGGSYTSPYRHGGGKREYSAGGIWPGRTRSDGKDCPARGGCAEHHRTQGSRGSRCGLTQNSFEVATEMVAWFTPDGRVRICQRRHVPDAPILPRRTAGLSGAGLSPGFSWEEYAEHWREVRERKSFTLEVTLAQRRAATTSAEVLVNHVVYGGQEYIFAYGRDITLREQAEAAVPARAKNDCGYSATTCPTAQFYPIRTRNRWQRPVPSLRRWHRAAQWPPRRGRVRDPARCTGKSYPSIWNNWLRPK